MTRHIVYPANNMALTYGWDRPMNTYFFQLEDLSRDDEEEQLIIDVGDFWDLIPDLESFKTRVSTELQKKGLSPYEFSEKELKVLEDGRIRER